MSTRALIRKLGLEPLFLGLCALTVPTSVGIALAVTDGNTANVDEPAYIAPVTLTPPPLEVFSLLPIQIAHGRPVGGVQHVAVSQGDNVTIGIEVDASGTVVVEGYDVWAQVHANEQTMIDLTAWNYGDFAVKLDGRLIGMVQVRPAWARPLP